MAGRYDSDPFQEEDVNPFAETGRRGKVAGSNYGGGPLSSADLKKKERELQAKEAELDKREKELKRKEEAAAQAGVVMDEKIGHLFFLLFIMILQVRYPSTCKDCSILHLLHC
ncbi:unnamed protein product [Musa acuminata subsp. burmannicoides]